MLLKEEIIRMLSEREGDYFSGAEMAQHLKVSRNAVWKAVKSLKEDGYRIEAGTNRGYCLLIKPDILNADEIKENLSTQILGKKIVLLKSVGSTNDEAKKLAQNGAKEGTIVIAEEQTAGKGRMGSRFLSPKQQGIYLSVILRPQIPLNDSLLFTCAAAVAAAQAIEKMTGLCIQIKWVNDLYLEKRKCGGIMTEAVASFENASFEYIVIGFGINVNTNMDVLKELHGQAISLSQCLHGKTVFRNQLVAEILNKYEPILQNFSKKDFMQAYRKRLMMMGQMVDIVDASENKVIETGKLLDVDTSGHLLIENRMHQVKKQSAAQIHLRPSNDKGESINGRDTL